MPATKLSNHFLREFADLAAEHELLMQHSQIPTDANP